MTYIPALDVSPPDDTRAWIVYYNEDYDNFIKDADGNIAILVNEEQAQEAKRLADGAIEIITEENND